MSDHIDAAGFGLQQAFAPERLKQQIFNRQQQQNDTADPGQRSRHVQLGPAGCKRRPHVFYEARAAQLCADSVLVSSRRGIDADEPAAAARLEAIRDCLRRGLSPEQMAARNGGPVDLSPSTIYRWVSAGYDGMTNMELRRKVGYRPRKRAAGRAATRHSARRSHAAFLALGEDACAAAWEMDTVEGAREDSACLLTLLHRPSRLQLALPLEEKTAGCVADALEGRRHEIVVAL